MAPLSVVRVASAAGGVRGTGGSAGVTLPGTPAAELRPWTPFATTETVYVRPAPAPSTQLPSAGPASQVAGPGSAVTR
ncbi:hypothetical protein ACPPVO_34190 [Dactylosporangium sp. McL0621]|uniref:hypothetical protein n=1 Tax=Dactylosporangium sp. McL0621 TaxID=3415678 RepID=UPI003CFB88B5